jgi:hypothetical protein
MSNRKPLHTLASDAIDQMPFLGNSQFTRWSELSGDVVRYIELQMLQAAYGERVDLAEPLAKASSKLQAILDAGCLAEARTRTGAADSSNVSHLQGQFHRDSMALVEDAVSQAIGRKK